MFSQDYLNEIKNICVTLFANLWNIERFSDCINIV